MYLPSDGPGPGTCHVRAPAPAVGDRLAVAREDRLPAQHVALDTGCRSVIIDGQGAHRGGRLLITVADVRLLADEVLVLDLAPGHAGLDDVVLAVELGAVSAVTLLEPPGGAVDATARGDHPVRLAGFDEQVPEPCALLDRHIQLPAEVTDVGDAGGEHLDRADLDVCAAARTGSPRARRLAAQPRRGCLAHVGPRDPSVVHALVWSCTWADPSAGRWSLNHFRSDMP